MPRPGLSAFFSVVEIRTKLVSVSTLLLAACYVVWRQGFPPVMPFILMWAATLAVDMGTTAFNNYFDYWRGTDSYREVDETDKVLVRSGVDPAFAFWSAFGCFTVAVFLGLAIACLGFWWVVPAGASAWRSAFSYRRAVPHFPHSVRGAVCGRLPGIRPVPYRLRGMVPPSGRRCPPRGPSVWLLDSLDPHRQQYLRHRRRPRCRPPHPVHPPRPAGRGARRGLPRSRRRGSGHHRLPPGHPSPFLRRHPLACPCPGCPDLARHAQARVLPCDEGREHAKHPCLFSLVQRLPCRGLPPLSGVFPRPPLETVKLDGTGGRVSMIP